MTLNFKEWRQRAIDAVEDGKSYFILESETKTDCALWWKPNHKGYTHNIKAAGVYSAKEARRIAAETRGTDIPFECDLIMREAAVIHVPRDGLYGLDAINPKIAREKSENTE